MKPHISKDMDWKVAGKIHFEEGNKRFKQRIRFLLKCVCNAEIRLSSWMHMGGGLQQSLENPCLLGSGSCNS